MVDIVVDESLWQGKEKLARQSNSESVEDKKKYTLKGYRWLRGKAEEK